VAGRDVLGGSLGGGRTLAPGPRGERRRVRRIVCRPGGLVGRRAHRTSPCTSTFIFISISAANPGLLTRIFALASNPSLLRRGTTRSSTSSTEPPPPPS